MLFLPEKNRASECGAFLVVGKLLDLPHGQWAESFFGLVFLESLARHLHDLQEWGILIVLELCLIHSSNACATQTVLCWEDDVIA